MKNHCKNCPNRRIGCHNKCDEYIEFQTKLEKAKEEKRQDDIGLCYTMESIERRKANKKRRTRK